VSDNITRRTLVKGAVGTAALTPLLTPGAGRAATVAKPPRHSRSRHAAPDASPHVGPYDPDQFPADDELFWAPGLPGGGQLEIRMYVESYTTDPDLSQIAPRLYPFNLDSYYKEFLRVAQNDEALAAQAEAQGNAALANQYYLRAANLYGDQNILAYLSEHDPRMLPTYRKLEENFEKAWSLVSPPFERVQIPYEDTMLNGLFFAAPVSPGHRAPVVVSHGGADSNLLSGSPNQGAPYTSRGISFIAFDAPGMGGALRLQKLYAPPDADRYVTPVVDYLVTRPDVDPDRIGITGASMGGYGAPRALTGEKRLKVGAFWAGAFDLQRDIFDYYPPIQDKLRWLIGAKNLKQARAKMGEFTLRDRVREIEAPILIGYSTDDRVMNPGGARELYDKAVNARSRALLPGAGHNFESPPPPLPPSYQTPAVNRTTAFVDFFAKQFGIA
jgi:dienelactone hydrolase